MKNKARVKNINEYKKRKKNRYRKRKIKRLAKPILFSIPIFVIIIINLSGNAIMSNYKYEINTLKKELRKEENKIYIITARDESGMPEEYYGKMQQLTKEWLNKHEIEYDKLIFAKDKEKLQKCIENNVEIMIEDSPNNIKDISTKIKVIKFDCQYNKNVQGENIITAYSWYHIYDIINKTKKGE